MIVIYLCNKIIARELDYSYVVFKRPDLQTGIDEFLTINGHSDLIK